MSDAQLGSPRDNRDHPSLLICSVYGSPCLGPALAHWAALPADSGTIWGDLRHAMHAPQLHKSGNLARFVPESMSAVRYISLATDNEAISCYNDVACFVFDSSSRYLLLSA